MGRLHRHLRLVGAMAACALTVVAGPHPSSAAPAPQPTVTVRQAWTIPAPGPMTGSPAWARTPGVFFTPDSTLAYSALGFRYFSGRYTCDDLGPGPASVVQAVDTRSGAVVSTITPDLPPGAPVSSFAMDDGAQRIVVLSGICPSYIWTTLDATTGATLARWEAPFTQLPAHVAMGPDPSWLYLVDSLPGDRVDSRAFRVQAINTITGQVHWTSNLGVRPWADFLGDLPTRQYRAQSLAVSADGSQIYVLPATASEVLILDASTGQQSGRVQLPPSTDVRSIAVSPVSPRLFVSDWATSTIRIVDTDRLMVSGQFSIPGRCLESMDIDATGDVLAVLAACDNPRIILVRTADGSVLAEGPAPGDGSEIRMLPNGTGLVTRRSAELIGTAIAQTPPVSTPGKKVRPTPASPRAVAVTVGSTTAVVAWRPPANATAAKVTGYRVITRPGNRSCVVKARVTTCTMTGLVPGRRYAFTVEARNSAGWGLRTVSPVITVPLPPRPTPPPTPPPSPVPMPKPSAPVS